LISEFKNFEECAIRVQRVLTDALTDYPQSDIVKQKELEWGSLVQKYSTMSKDAEDEKMTSEQTPQHNVGTKNYSLDCTQYYISGAIMQEVEERVFSGPCIDKPTIRKRCDILTFDLSITQLTPDPETGVNVESDTSKFQVATSDKIVHPNVEGAKVAVKGANNEEIMDRKRTARFKVLAHVLRSLYVRRHVSLGEKTKLEDNVAKCIFSAFGEEG
jgi:hypothetical protein